MFTQQHNGYTFGQWPSAVCSWFSGSIVTNPTERLLQLIDISDFYRATACNATHGIADGILSVCLSVRCVYCDKTKQRTANILIPHERAITLDF